MPDSDALPASGPRRRWPAGRWRWIALACTLTAAVARVVLVIVRAYHADQPWNEGYARVGTVAGTVFWAKAGPSGTILIQGVHGRGDGCGYSGPDLSAAGRSRAAAVLGPGIADAQRLCERGGLRGTDFAAWLLPASAPPVTVGLSDGSTETQTASLSLSTVATGQTIRVVVVDRPGVSITSS